ncbi:NAD/NADP-dependent indole-3-acetaldehyde reductase [Leucoagaricus sp. SymC.cos]|nr:NAD/NADP-dependent indole-3-acetaldehyde reductase [Leucoagaricus sp. SymC.cos]
MPFPDIPLADGNAIPAIAFGTGTANLGKDVHESVENALEAGFSHIDAAQFYMNEESIGVAIRESGLARSEIFVTTKWSGVISDVHKSLEISLSKLGLEYVDLFLIHTPTSTEGKLESVWRTFEEVREAGLTKSIGVSNFSIKQLEELLKVARVKPVVNQVRFHPYNWAENKALLEFHTKHGIVTEGYSTLIPITRLPGGPVDAALAPAAKRLNATPVQVIFSWVKAKGVVIVTTTSKRERLKEYLEVGDLPDLTPDEVAAIDEAGLKGPPSAWSSKPTLNSGSSAKRWRRWLFTLFVFIVILYNFHRFCPVSEKI